MFLLKLISIYSLWAKLCGHQSYVLFSFWEGVPLYFELWMWVLWPLVRSGTDVVGGILGYAGNLCCTIPYMPGNDLSELVNCILTLTANADGFEKKVWITCKETLVKDSSIMQFELDRNLELDRKGIISYSLMERHQPISDFILEFVIMHWGIMLWKMDRLG